MRNIFHSLELTIGINIGVGSLDTTVGVSHLLLGGVDVGVAVVQVTELILSVELTANRVWCCSWSCNRSSSWGSSWGSSPVGHHCLSCVGEGVVGGIVVAMIARIAMVAVVAMIWLIVLLVRLVARVDEGRLEMFSLSTGGRQKAGQDQNSDHLLSRDAKRCVPM